jgi:hypothetical protein
LLGLIKNRIRMKRIKERFFGIGVLLLLAVLHLSCGFSGTSESVLPCAIYKVC